MVALARQWLQTRTHLGQRWPWLVVLAVWPLIALGGLSSAGLWRGDLSQLLVLTSVAGSILAVVSREVAVSENTADAHWRELEAGLLLITGTYALLGMTGGIRSFLYPLIYAVVSFLVVLGRTPAVASGLVLATAMLEILTGWNDSSVHASRLIGLHLTFLGFFAVGHRMALSGLVRRLRGDHERRVETSLLKIQADARDFRVTGEANGVADRERVEAQMTHAAVVSIHEQLFHVLDLLRTAMSLQSCVLIWCDNEAAESSRRDRITLSIKGVSTVVEGVEKHQVLAAPGVLTPILSTSAPLVLSGMTAKRRPPYYSSGAAEVTDLCAVPVLHRGRLRGVLCADRANRIGFTSDDVRVLVQAAEQAQRVIAHERTFIAVERSKYEQEQFFRSSELLNEALTLEQVYHRSFAALKAIVPYDLAVLTGTDRDGQSVLATDGDGEWRRVADALKEQTLTDPKSLVAISIKNRHFVPAGGHVLDPEVVVFTPQTKLRAAKSLLVLPLIRGEQVLGAMTLASTKPGLFPARTREMLRVIGHQVGVSLQNARMYQSMETRATTDGLTGLTNHRSFQDRLSQIHDLAERTGQKYALILTDIDHFKKVNDTYGHPVGDQVLRRVADVFRGRARKVDVVARYGGEEFVLVLPDTSGEGAEHFANQLRQEIGELCMTSEQGSFKVTISMGVAEFPTDGRDRMALIEKADQALYFCKEHGRNCVRRWAKVGAAA